MVKDSVLTGIETLDKLIGGGFEPGSLILVAGRPGTGKTSFATQFVCKGVEEGEVGVYVSFAEDKSTLICNMEKTLGYGCEEYVKSGKLKILDMIVTRKESVSAILDLILSEASEAKRLVIDSFSAMVQAFKDPVESRIILHAILSRMVRQFRCTTLLICEVPVGEERIGFGIEEFVADGVILLRMNELEGHIFRDLEIKKLRGRQLLENKIVLTLNGGRIKAFQPFSPKPIEKQAKFNPIKDPPEKFSTGNPDLDRLLEGGYPRGGTVVFEVSEKITTSQYSLLISPTAWNFVVNNRWVLIIPSIGVNYNVVMREAEKGGFTEDMVKNLLRVSSFEFVETREKPCIFKVKGESIEEDLQKVLNEVYKVMEKTSQPVLSIIGVDTIASYYGPEKVLRAINIGTHIARTNDSLIMLILKPGYPNLGDNLKALADVHLKLVREHGVLLLYGIKPRRGLHAVEMDTSQGYPLAKLTPIT